MRAEDFLADLEPAEPKQSAADFLAAEQSGPIRQAIGRYAQGVGSSLAGIPESIGVAATKLGDVSESVGLGRFGQPKTPQETGTYKAGQWIRDWYARNYPVDETRKHSFVGDTLPQGAGSMVGFMLTGAAGKAARLPAALTVAGAGAATGGAEAYREAISAGADDGTAFKVFLVNAGLGTTEAVPIAGWLNRLNKVSGGRLKRAIIEGTEEAAQEVFQQFGSNLTASKTFDPNRKLFEGAGEGGAAGFTLGSLMSLVVSAAGGKRAGRGQATTKKPDAEQFLKGEQGYAESTGEQVTPPSGEQTVEQRAQGRVRLRRIKGDRLATPPGAQPTQARVSEVAQPEATVPLSPTPPIAQPVAPAAAPVPAPAERGPTMDYARAIVDMPPATFREQNPGGFNDINIPLGQSIANESDLNELIALRDKANARLQRAMAAFQAEKSPKNQLELSGAMYIPQFFNEAIKAAQDKLQLQQKPKENGAEKVTDINATDITAQQTPSATPAKQSPLPVEQNVSPAPVISPADQIASAPTVTPAVTENQPTKKGKGQSIRARAAEFNQLLRDYADKFKWAQGQLLDDLHLINPGTENLGTVGIKGSIARKKAIKAVQEVVARQLDLDPRQIGVESYRSQHLDKLRALVGKRVDFEQATRDEGDSAGKIDVPATDLEVGDKLMVDGEEFTVRRVTPTYIEIEDGRRFGKQVLSPNDTIYVEGYEPKPQEAAQPAPAPVTPKLRPGEKAGELLQGADQPFNLAGERGIDTERVAKEKADKEAAAKAAAEFDKQNQLELGAKPQQKGGVTNEEKGKEEVPVESPTGAGPSEVSVAGEAATAPVKPFSVGSKVQLRGLDQKNNPIWVVQTHTIVREVTDPKFPDERIFEVQNDKTGEIQEIDQNSMRQVNERAEADKTKRKGKKELQDELIRLNPKYRTTVKDYSIKQLRDLIKREKEKNPQTSIEGKPDENQSQILESGQATPAPATMADASRVAQDLEGSGEVLRGNRAQITQAFTAARNRTEKPQSKIRQALVARNRIRSGSEKQGPEVHGKARVFIEENPEAQNSVVERLANLLAHRFLFGSDKAAASEGPVSAKQRSDFLASLSKKLTGLKLVFVKLGDGRGLAEYQPDNDAVVFNLDEIHRYNEDELVATANEEILHAATKRLTTKAERESVWNSLSKAEQKAALDAYATDPGTNEYRGYEYLRMILQERLTGETTEQHSGYWRITEQAKEALQKIINFLKQTFGAKPESDIARQVIERLESAIRGDAPIEDNVFETGEAVRSSIQPVQDEIVEEPTPPRRRRAQVLGERIGDQYDVQAMAPVIESVRRGFFDAREPVTPERTAQALNLANLLTDERAKSIGARELTDQLEANSDAGLQILHNELMDYALKAAIAGDQSLARMMVSNWGKFSVVKSGAGLSEAARALRAVQESKAYRLVSMLAEQLKGSQEAARRSTGTDQTLWDRLLEALATVKIDPESLEAEILALPVGNGQTVRDILAPIIERATNPELRAQNEQAELGLELEEINKRVEQQALALANKYELTVFPGKGKPNIVIQTIRDFLATKPATVDRPEAQVPVSAKLTVDELASKLVEIGVTPETAARLSYDVYEKRERNWQEARLKAQKAASERGSIWSLVRDILETPYLAQKAPNWRLQMAENWFMRNGLSREQAQAAAKTFNSAFEKKMTEAGEEVARKILEGKADPRTMQDIFKGIRSGLMDPDRTWTDSIAERDGWKAVSREQFKKLAELEMKAMNPELSPQEFNAIEEEMMAIMRHVGPKYTEGSYWRRISEGFVASLLSGIRTMTVQGSPIIALVRDYPIAALRDHKNAYNYLKIIGEAATKVFKSEFKYAWQKDAYGYHLETLDRQHKELKRWFENLEQEYQDAKNPATKAWVLVRKLYAAQQYVSRMLSTIDQSMMASTREVKLAYYTSTALKEAGLSTQLISELIDTIAKARASEYEDAINQGLDETTARVRANARIDRAVWEFVNTATGKSTLADQVLQSAEKDVYSIVGRKAAGVKEEEEGFASRFTGMNKLMTAISSIRSEGGLPAILAVALTGFVNVPFRTARYFSSFHPYGLLRYGIYRWRTNRGKENFWKQTYGTELQARQRLNEAIAGTVVMVLASAWAAGNSSADDDDDKEFGFYITGAGPSKKELRDAWLKDGFRPYSMIFKIGGVKVKIPITRIGESLMFPLMLPASLDDAAWKMKERKASGRPDAPAWNTILGSIVGTHMYMSGQKGMMQGVVQLAQAAQGGQGVVKSSAKILGGTLSASAVPFKQLINSFSEMLIGDLDKSSASALVAAQFPIAGMPWQKKAINRFGDPTGERTWFGLIERTGIPISFRLPDTKQNREMYPMLVEKGISPPELRRYIVEERYGDLTNDQWEDFAQKSGSLLKQSVLSNLSRVKRMSADDAKDFLQKAATQADKTAAAALGLQPVKKTAQSTERPTAPSVGSRQAQLASPVAFPTATPIRRAPSAFRSSIGRGSRRSSLAAYRTPRLRSSRGRRSRRSVFRRITGIRRPRRRSLYA